MITDEQLILYFYADGLTANESKHIEQTLDNDPLLAQRYARLCQDLKTFANVPMQPASPAAQQRWHRSLDNATKSNETQSTVSFFDRFSAPMRIGATAAVLALGIFIGLQLGDNTVRSEPDQQSVNHNPTDSRPLSKVEDATTTTLTRSLSQHLLHTQIQLASFHSADDSQREQLAQQIIYQNRLFSRAADRADAKDIARLLRALESVLISMASPAISSDEILVQTRQLEFELDLTLTKMSQRASKNTFDL